MRLIVLLYKQNCIQFYLQQQNYVLKHKVVIDDNLISICLVFAFFMK